MKYSLIILIIFLVLSLIILFKERVNNVETFNPDTQDSQDTPVIIYYHIAEIGDWENIVKEQLHQIRESGLYHRCQEIRIGFLGEKSKITNYVKGKVKLIYHSTNVKEYEIPTINSLLDFSKNCEKEHYILYIHNKGSTFSKLNIVNNHVHNWRKMMMYYMVTKFKQCLPYLTDYDTIGCNLRESKNYYCKIGDEKHNYHYSGNFWWSKSGYLKTLPEINVECNHYTYRYLAESWLLYNLPNLKSLIIQSTPETHLYNKSYDIAYFQKHKQLATVDKNMEIKQLGITFQ